MLKFLKLGAVLFGLALAFITYVDDVKATAPPVTTGGCVGDGACGITEGGTRLIGKWVE